MSSCPLGYSMDNGTCRNAEGYAPPIVVPAPAKCNVGKNHNGAPCNLLAFQKFNTDHPYASLKIPVSALDCGTGGSWDPVEKGCHCPNVNEVWMWNKDPSKMGCKATTS